MLFAFGAVLTLFAGVKCAFYNIVAKSSSFFGPLRMQILYRWWEISTESQELPRHCSKESRLLVVLVSVMDNNALMVS